MLLEKLKEAKRICAEQGTEITEWEQNKPYSQCKVTKRCLKDDTHELMEVSLRSIVTLKRGGCRTCARIKGGKNRQASRQAAESAKSTT